LEALTRRYEASASTIDVRLVDLSADDIAVNRD